MDSDRKYRQHGYMDTDRDGRGPRDDRPKPQGPRPPIDVTGPRLPRLVQHVAASRCYNCSTALPEGTDFNGVCPKCNVALHCCKQCSHFEPSTRFQCLKPIPVRIPVKDGANECSLFNAARDGGARRNLEWLRRRNPPGRPVHPRRATRKTRAAPSTSCSRRYNVARAVLRAASRVVSTFFCWRIGHRRQCLSEGAANC